MPPKNNNRINGWLLALDKVESGETKIEPKELNLTVKPRILYGYAVPLTSPKAILPVLTTAGYIATHPTETIEGIKSIPGAISEIGDRISSTWSNMMRPRTQETRPLNSSAIYVRPVERTDAIVVPNRAIDWAKGIYRALTGKVSPTVSSEPTTSDPVSRNDSVPKPSNKNPKDPEPSNKNPKDPKNKKNKVFKWGLAIGGEQVGGSIFDAIATNAARKKARQEGVNYLGEHVAGLPWYTPLGALHGLYELTVDTKKENIILEAKNQAKPGTTTTEQSTPKVETLDSVQLSKEDQDLLNQILGQ